MGTPLSPTMLLDFARRHAQSGQFPQMLAVCRQLLAADDLEAPTLVGVGALLSEFGFLALARDCFAKAQRLFPDLLAPVVNLANVARDAGDHARARGLYAALLRLVPGHPVIRRNALTSLEYDPEATAAARLAQARDWGAWATALAKGPHPRPPLRPLPGRPLRVGYVSADFCQHTVGLFVKDVLKAHDPARVTAIAYSAGRVADWVGGDIRSACLFHDVAALDDAQLAALIRRDAIDVLVDLSGHTAGSRLTVFAHRPAPVQVSWLGYFATTGLACLDAILLDAWHAPDGTQRHFVEPVIRLPKGRFCYQPVPFAPEVAPPPRLRNGHVTFGSFNNTAKLNPAVYDLWARTLAAVPDSRLVLKWRTFNDEAFRDTVRAAFAQRGIDPARIEPRGPSFHADLLKEYADIDIALDTFPFTGGLTSCEALWMGVAVVTLPQDRVVSRQTLALVSAIGLPELAAATPDDFVRIASGLANDTARLADLRQTLRERMRAAPLMDVPGFTRSLEDTLLDLFRRVAATPEPARS